MITTDSGNHEIQENVSLALDEMRSQFDRQLQAGAALDSKANLLITAVTVLITLVAGLGIVLHSTGLPTWYPSGALAAVIVFAVLVGFGAFAIGPRYYRTPLAAELDVIGQSILAVSTYEAYQALVRGYVEQIQSNDRVMSNKAWLVRIGLVALVVNVCLLVILALTAPLPK